MILVYAILNIVLIYMGIKLYKKWINPISLYSIVWLIAVGIHESGLIVFYDLSIFTWFTIFLFQTVFVLACYLGLEVKVKIKCNKKINTNNEKKYLKYYITITTCIAAISILYAFLSVVSIYGTNILGMITDIYADRVGGLSEVKTIPYLGSFIYIALILIGVYIKKYGFSLLSIPAIVLVFLNSLTSGGRAGIVFCLVLFFFAFYITPANVSPIKGIPLRKIRLKRSNKKIKNFILALAVIIIFLIFFILISSERTAGSTNTYATSLYKAIFGDNALIYKILTYISGPIGALNEYLKECEFNFGQNTFLTIYNLLARFGLIDRIEQYQEFFSTPLKCNVGTWIRELIEDFLYPGAIICAFIFSLVSSISYRKTVKSHSISSTIISSVCMLTICLSFFDWRLRNSNIWISFIFGYFIGRRIDNKSVAHKKRKK